MTQAIRLSPSGPNIANAGGAPLAPGLGARLRLVEGNTTFGGSNQIPTAANYAASVAIAVNFGTPPALVDTLLLPNPGYNYRGTVLLDVTNPTTNTNGVVQLYLETSVDGGITWAEQASNQHLIFGQANSGQARQMRLDLPLTNGVTLGVTSGSPSIKLRARIGATVGGGVLLAYSGDTGDGVSKGACVLQLEECY